MVQEKVCDFVEQKTDNSSVELAKKELAEKTYRLTILLRAIVKLGYKFFKEDSYDESCIKNIENHPICKITLPIELNVEIDKCIDLIQTSGSITQALNVYKEQMMKGFSKEERQSKGKVYTKDPSIVKWIHDKLEQYWPISLSKTYWEPACGTGTFVLDWHERLMKHWKNNKEKYPELGEDEDKVHRYIIENCIYFSDIDPFAIRLCCLSLFLKNPRVTGLKFNKYEGDSLLDEPFKQVDKFDYVAGNPPYISMVDSLLDQTYKKRLRKKFDTYSGKGDIYYLFVEEAIKRNSGLVNFVVQDTFILGKPSNNLRELLKAKGAIVDSYNVSWSQSAMLSVRVFCFKLNESQEKETLLNINDKNPLLCKLKAFPSKLKELTRAKQGINTGNNDIFIVQKEQALSLGLENHCMSPVLPGAKVRTYVQITPQQLDKIAIICNGIEEKDFPNVKKYLDEYKKVLEERHIMRAGTIKRIYDIGQHVTWPRQDNLVIAALYTETCKDFAICTSSTVQGISGSSYGLEKLKKGWLALLNSNVAAYFYSCISKKRTANLFQRSGDDVGELPLPSLQLDFRLDPLVDKMLLNPNDKETEAEINKIVYELYGLTEEEIKVVEETVK